MPTSSPSSALIFGKYEIQERLAAGGMGEVFLARQVGVPGFERRAILKSLLPDLARQASAVEQFLDEARIAATLNHPNVVSIYEVGLWEDTYYIAMEYIDGDSLSGLRKAARSLGQALPMEVAVKVAQEAALGLAHAHGAVDMSGNPMDIVHRDISPQNIMVRRDGVTKVVDFGIARAAHRATQTQVGLIKGKLAYLPPEYVGGESLDARGDQYALGVVLWEMLTGRRVFGTAAEVDLATKILRGVQERPSQAAPEVPADLDAIVMRLLAREPGDRFAHCNEAALALGRWLEQHAPGMSAVQVASAVGPLLELRRPNSRTAPRQPATLPDVRAILSRVSIAPPASPVAPAAVSPVVSEAPPPQPASVSGAVPRPTVGSDVAEEILRAVAGTLTAAPKRAVGLVVGVLAALLVIAMLASPAAPPPSESSPIAHLETKVEVAVPPPPPAPAEVPAPMPPDRFEVLAPLANARFGGRVVPGLRCDGAPTMPLVTAVEDRAGAALRDSRYREAVELYDGAIGGEPEAGRLYVELAQAVSVALSPSQSDRLLRDLESFQAACPSTEIRLLQAVITRLSPPPSPLSPSKLLSRQFAAPTDGGHRGGRTRHTSHGNRGGSGDLLSDFGP